MEQSSGGHYLDTGDGPASVDPPAEAPSVTATEPEPAVQQMRGRATESPMAAAYREYVTHCQKCLQCRGSVFRCGTGDELWDAYVATR